MALCSALTFKLSHYRNMPLPWSLKANIRASSYVLIWNILQYKSRDCCLAWQVKISDIFPLSATKSADQCTLYEVFILYSVPTSKNINFCLFELQIHRLVMFESYKACKSLEFYPTLQRKAIQSCTWCHTTDDECHDMLYYSERWYGMDSQGAKGHSDHQLF